MSNATFEILYNPFYTFEIFMRRKDVQDNISKYLLNRMKNFTISLRGAKIVTHMTNDKTRRIYPIREDMLYTLCMKTYMYELTMLTHSISCVHHSIML